MSHISFEVDCVHNPNLPGKYINDKRVTIKFKDIEVYYKDKELFEEVERKYPKLLDISNSELLRILLDYVENKK